MANDRTPPGSPPAAGEILRFTPTDVEEFRYPLATIVDRTGRSIDVRRIDVRYTFDGFLEGEPWVASSWIREGLSEDPEQGYGTWPPIQVVDDPVRPLPGVRVFVSMLSFLPVPTPDGLGALSLLGLCFFMRRSEVTFGRILELAAGLVEWDAHAANGEW